MRLETDTNRPDPLASTEFDDSDVVTEGVVHAVAAVDDTPIEELPPLTESVDPDALTTLFAANTTGHVTFVYNDYDVVVSSTGEISVY